MTLNHSQELNNLLSLVVRELSDDHKYKTIVEYGPLEINAFSITFWVNFDGDYGMSSIYVKIPKFIFFDKKINFLTPLTQADVTLANDEYKSLNYFSTQWDRSFGVGFVKVLGYIKEYNAIITERIQGKFFFKLFRQSDLLRKYKEQKHDPIMLGMYNFGKSLQAFHSQAAVDSIFRADEVFSKLNHYVNFLKNCNVSYQYLDDLLFSISKYENFECPALIVNNFKGIDIRQIFFNHDNILLLFDPGKISQGYSEIDLARFIVTCRILYWGTFAIFLKVIPDGSYEDKFLNGYYGLKKSSEKMLNILIIKELFKQWIMAHSSHAKREWPKFFKYLVQKLYIDPFYKWLISNELLELQK